MGAQCLYGGDQKKLPAKKQGHPVTSKKTTDLLIGQLNQDVKNTYSYRNTLGQGSYGKVLCMEHGPTKVERAVKIINKESMKEKELALLKDEFRLLKAMDHPNIVRVYELYESKKQLCIVTQLLSGGQLFQKLMSVKHFGERQAAKIIQVVLGAINYCHINGICHRDLKPENILYAQKNSDVIKIVDFGCSRHTGEHMSELIGTPYYIAPEVIAQNYNQKCDVWSIGVILYILLTGVPPFGGTSQQQILYNIKTQKHSIKVLEEMRVSREGINLINRMLERNVDKRPNAEQCLQDEWFKIQLGKSEIAWQKDSINETMTNLKRFFRQNKLQQALQSYYFTFFGRTEDNERLTKAFKLIDKDKDGLISKAELQKLIRSNVDPSNLDTMTTVLNNFPEGRDINYSQFLVAAANHSKILNEGQIKQIFRMVDKDGSGVIQFSELKKILSGASDQDIKAMMKEAHLAPDENINYEQWKGLMNQRVSVLQSNLK